MHNPAHNPLKFAQRINKKGVILFIVLAIILTVVISANIILRIVLSQSRLTRHQTARIQAYYAALAGINVALDKLRTGAWTYSPNSCQNSTPCTIGPCLSACNYGPATCANVTECDFPKTIVNQTVMIIFCTPGQNCMNANCTSPPGSNFCIYANATYTYTE